MNVFKISMLGFALMLISTLSFAAPLGLSAADFNQNMTIRINSLIVPGSECQQCQNWGETCEEGIKMMGDENGWDDQKRSEQFNMICWSTLEGCYNKKCGAMGPAECRYTDRGFKICS